MYDLENGEYYDYMMRLDQSRARKALIAVYSNDNLTLIQHFKNKNGKKRFIWLQNTNHQINLWFSLQIDDFSFWFDPNSRSLERWLFI